MSQCQCYIMHFASDSASIFQQFMGMTALHELSMCIVIKLVESNGALCTVTDTHVLACFCIVLSLLSVSLIIVDMCICISMHICMYICRHACNACVYDVCAHSVNGGACLVLHVPALRRHNTEVVQYIVKMYLAQH